MYLKYVTITGAGEETDVSKLLKLTEKFPFVEWGILLSSTQKDNPKFPKLQWITNFILKLKEHCEKKVRGDYFPNISFHICGVLSRDLLIGKINKDWYSVVPDFSLAKRIQLNFNLSHALFNSLAFNELLSRRVDFRRLKIISQYNDYNVHFWKEMLNQINIEQEILFDSSGGNGKVINFDKLPKPFAGIMCGYSGGLGPDNIDEFLPKLNEHIGTGLCWIDMETNVRTDNQLDLDKVEYVLSKCYTYKSGGLITTYAKGGSQSFVY